MSAKTTAVKTIGILGKIQPDNYNPVLSILEETHIKHKISFLLAEEVFLPKDKAGRKLCESKPFLEIRPETEIIKKATHIFSLGGDGTLLRTARLIGKKNTPIIGVNFGKLGFLTEFNPEEIYGCADLILKDKCIYDSRMVLTASVWNEENELLEDDLFWAMNDIVVDKSGYSKLITLDISVGKDRVGFYRADGIILSTPVGSTGYSLACGGPIMFPAMDGIILTPICPHTLTIRPLIIPTDKEITIIAHTQYHEILVAADGESKTYKTNSLKIKIRKANVKVNLVRNVKRTYYDVLRQKLNWSNDTRGTQL